jgi:ATP synthase assembly factor FMC1
LIPPAMSQPTTHLYRSILRELRLAVCCSALILCIESLLIAQSRKSRITRNPTVHTHIREVVAAGPTDLNKTLLEIRDFLKSTRIHAVSVIPCILALGVGGGSQRLNHRPMDCGIASGIAALNVPLLILQELLKRYNPIADMTEEERIHATARRVGLDTPQEYKKD